MNIHEKLPDIMDLAAEAASIEFVRGNQSGPRLNYPYMTYLVLSSDGREDHSMERSNSDNPSDPEKPVLVSDLDTKTTVVSISFFDASDFKVIQDKADLVLDWFRSIDGKEAMKADPLNVVARTLSPIGIRAPFKPGDAATFEAALGFDVQFTERVAVTQEVEGIETVEIEINGEKVEF